jgi:hypothetical protein
VGIEAGHMVPIISLGLPQDFDCKFHRRFVSAMATCFILFIVACLLAIVYATNIKNNEFLVWYEKNGGSYHHKLSLTRYDSMGNGLTAIDVIAEAEVLMKLPSKMTLSNHSLSTSTNPLHVRIARAFQRQTDELSIILTLIIEKLRGEESFFFPYIQVLPEYVPSLIYFNDSELLELQQADLVTSAKSYQKTLRRNYNDMIKTASSILSEDLLYQINYDLFLWASSIVDSRGLRFRGKLNLVPLADMMNYSPHPQARSNDAGEFFLKYHNISKDEVTIYSDRTHLPGQQIFEDYGDNFDTIYATHHGFVPDVNPFRCVKVVSPPLTSVSNETLPFLKSLRFNGAPGRCVDSSFDIGQAMTVYFTAISFDEDEISTCFKKTNLTSPNWPFVFQSCDFDNVKTFLQEVVNRNWNDVVVFPRRLRDSNEPPTSSMMNDSRFDELLNDSSSLEKRALSSLRRWLEIIQPQYTTSLEDDILAYEALLVKSGEGDSAAAKTRAHQLLSLKYRIHQKLLWANLCSVYGAQCFIWSLAPESEDLKDGSLANDESVVGPDIVDDFLNPDSLTMQAKLDRFNQWFQAAVDNNKPSSAISLLQAVEFDGYRIGAVATLDIQAEEIYLQVPSSIILDSKKAKSSPVSELLDKLTRKFSRSDEYHELLFLLMHQRYVDGSRSDFWPYLSLLPTSKDLIDLPVYWSADDVAQRIYPSFLYNSILHYRDRLVRMFEFVNSLEEVKDFFPPEVLTFDNYLWAASMLDSRSIWWDGKRHLVPMLDFVNCKELASNTSRLHQTKLVDGKLAETKAGALFKKGEQVFENYGQPNYIYFQFHGFTLISSEGVNENSHDCVHYEFTMTQKEGEAIDVDSEVAKTIFEKLNIQTKAAIFVCLNYPIPEEVWLFLALKVSLLIVEVCFIANLIYLN